MSQTPISQKRVQFSLNRGGTVQPQSVPKTPLTHPSPVTKHGRLSTTTPTPKAVPSSLATSSSSSASDSNAIAVGIRVRPLSAKERAQGYHESTFLDPDSNNTQIWVTDKSNKTLKFHCDFVITEQTSPNLPVTGVDGIVDPNIIGL